MTTKGIILVGGPSKGTRFRPLSLDTPKPLFPIAGRPMIWHQARALSQVPGLNEIILIGVYEDAVFAGFLKDCRREFPNVSISYLREFKALGTAGGLYHFRDAILRNSPKSLFLLNADVASSFPLPSLLEFHSRHRGVGTILSVRVPKGTEHAFGCIVADPTTGQARHYVEKPESFISDRINAGVYLFDQSLFGEIKDAMDDKAKAAAEDPLAEADDVVHLEQDVITRLAASGKLFTFETTDFWRQIKAAGSALPASTAYLEHFAKHSPELLTPPAAAGGEGPEVEGAVYVHPTATVHKTAKLGPNVAVGPGAVIEAGARVRDSILLDGVTVGKSACVVWAIVGADSKIGAWARVSGEPEVDKAGAPPKKLITILASDVTVAKEVCVRSCIVLPAKQLSRSSANEVLL